MDRQTLEGTDGGDGQAVLPSGRLKETERPLRLCRNVDGALSRQVRAVVERKITAAHRNIPLAADSNAIVERNHTTGKRSRAIAARGNPIASRDNPIA